MIQNTIKHILLQSNDKMGEEKLFSYDIEEFQAKIDFYPKKIVVSDLTSNEILNIETKKL